MPGLIAAMTLIKRTILAFALMAGISPAIAQAPPPVPALPDTERRTTYVISGSTCACAVGFQLYGDSTDYANWLEVFVNGALIPQSGNWTIASPTGSLATIPRPITNAVLTFTTAQTGTVQIVGARRPRRTSQFSESRGVAARDLNQVLSDLTAQNRETWDKTNDVTGRAVLARPGETLALLPVLASRLNSGACFDSNGNLSTCASIPSSTLIAGAGISLTGSGPTTIAANLAGGSGISISGTNPLVIGSSLTATSLPYTAPWTSAVSYPQATYNANVVYMTDFMGATTCDGVTDQFANMQAFLNAVAANGVSGKSVTGVFAPGNCFISAGSPTITINSSSLAQHYHLSGYGTTLTLDPTKAIKGLYVKRGTFLTHPDEQRSVLVEGLSVYAMDNANAVYGFEWDLPSVTFYRTQVVAGDNGVTHNQPGFAGYYGHQSNLNDGDGSTGPFWSRLTNNYCKGVGSGVSAVPICILVQGDANRLIIDKNNLGQATYGIFIKNACSTDTNPCAAVGDGILITENDIGAVQVGINFTTTLPGRTQLIGWLIVNNFVETAVQSFIDVSAITQQSAIQSVIGPNYLLSSPVYINNPNSISFAMMDRAQGQVTVNPASVAAGTTTTIASATAPGAAVTMPCVASAVGDTLGMALSCYVSGTSTITFRLANPTSGAIDLPSMLFMGQVNYRF